MKPNQKPMTELEMMLLREGWSRYDPNDVSGSIIRINAGPLVSAARSHAAKILHRIASRIESHALENQTL